MKTTICSDIEDINNLRLNDYLEILGIKPNWKNDTCTGYPSPFFADKSQVLVVNQVTNTFFDEGSGRQGKMMNLITSLFGCTPHEVISNIAPYRLHCLRTQPYPTINIHQNQTPCAQPS